MALPREIEYGYDCRSKINEGISATARPVISTLGPNGRNVLIDNGSVYPIITKDGVSVAKAISFSDKYKRIGATLVKDIAKRVDVKAGDGTTTATVISSNLLLGASDLADKGFDVNEARKGIKDAATKAIKWLNDHSIKIKDTDDIHKVALVSANGHEQIADDIAQAFASIGPDGSVILSYTSAPETIVDVSTGYKIREGYENSQFSNMTDGSFTVDDKKTVILIMRDSPTSWNDIQHIAQACKIAKLALVVMCPYFEGNFLAESYRALEKGILEDYCLIKTPGREDKNLGYSEETKTFAAMLGSKIYAAEDLAEVQIENLKTVDSIICKSGETTFEFESDKDGIEYKKIVNELKDIINSAGKDGGAAPDQIHMAKERLGAIEGGLAKIKIGAPTYAEREEMNALYTDALHAVESAIKNGVLPGAGVSMLRAARSITIDESWNPSYIAGVSLVKRVLEKPINLVVASKDPENAAYIIGTLAADGNLMSGYNARTGQTVVDMFEEGVIDPTLVETSAIEYSASMAGSYMCVDTVITNERDNIAFNEMDAFDEE